ncbi:hypothetical protein KIPB_001155 [Kipferlia bialata]|uniref:CUB domain-containing protein n=1 Tax=Kipferlia bialata TaxID=797122 RepID=A0A9K3GF21_9EUKA|nr:hypothetical protein KIPB_001155 [Kipferlia bialata]|eukprot:g1155.t1
MDYIYTAKEGTITSERVVDNMYDRYIVNPGVPTEGYVVYYSCTGNTQKDFDIVTVYEATADGWDTTLHPPTDSWSIDSRSGPKFNMGGDSSYFMLSASYESMWYTSIPLWYIALQTDDTEPREGIDKEHFTCTYRMEEQTINQYLTEDSGRIEQGIYCIDQTASLTLTLSLSLYIYIYVCVCVCVYVNTLTLSYCTDQTATYAVMPSNPIASVDIQCSGEINDTDKLELYVANCYTDSDGHQCDTDNAAVVLIDTMTGLIDDTYTLTLGVDGIGTMNQWYLRFTAHDSDRDAAGWSCGYQSHEYVSPSDTLHTFTDTHGTVQNTNYYNLQTEQWTLQGDSDASTYTAYPLKDVSVTCQGTSATGDYLRIHKALCGDDGSVTLGDMDTEVTGDLSVDTQLSFTLGETDANCVAFSWETNGDFLGDATGFSCEWDATTYTSAQFPIGDTAGTFDGPSGPNVLDKWILAASHPTMNMPHPRIGTSLSFSGIDLSVGDSLSVYVAHCAEDVITTSDSVPMATYDYTSPSISNLYLVLDGPNMQYETDSYKYDMNCVYVEYSTTESSTSPGFTCAYTATDAVDEDTQTEVSGGHGSFSNPNYYAGMNSQWLIYPTYLDSLDFSITYDLAEGDTIDMYYGDDCIADSFSTDDKVHLHTFNDGTGTYEETYYVDDGDRSPCYLLTMRTGETYIAATGFSVLYSYETDYPMWIWVLGGSCLFLVLLCCLCCCKGLMSNSTGDKHDEDDELDNGYTPMLNTSSYQQQPPPVSHSEVYQQNTPVAAPAPAYVQSTATTSTTSVYTPPATVAPSSAGATALPPLDDAPPPLPMWSTMMDDTPPPIDMFPSMGGNTDTAPSMGGIYGAEWNPDTQ